MKSYIVKKVDNDERSLQVIWQSISKVDIDCFPWDTSGYKPMTEVEMFYTNEYFKLRFIAHEKKVRAIYLNINEPVYEDSCVEFFIVPKSQMEERYMNFEFNAFGNLLLGIGSNRHNRALINVDPAIFEIKTSINPGNIREYDGSVWTLEFKIPFEFIEKYFGKIDFSSGYKMRGNFYKCGDKTKFPHYGSWNPIVNEKPDFHLSQYFGEFILE
ncbi:hypothetical protein JK636_15435 [Clostridium sp. YIM B02515]|uniref:Carbohydrate-binding domain-containing protein n=1 Tax=Clostridium rhizosphaerae TaxID=2803861 RepID=A0ABS1TCQ6_9CLOT|nr:hypothetical protein [Clostridium rhizosphaerae]